MTRSFFAVHMIGKLNPKFECAHLVRARADVDVGEQTKWVAGDCHGTTWAPKADRT